MSMTFEQIKNDPSVNIYIQQADDAMKAYGYTEHSFAHVTRAAQVASQILLTFGQDERQAELARIAAYLHDIGNGINRQDHAQSGAIMAFQLLNNMGMPAQEIAQIVAAIGNHDESSSVPVNAVAAALILADKTDVRRSRVRNRSEITFDIHDRVNYSVTKSWLEISEDRTQIKLELSVDTEYGSIMDYFEIFMQRMIFCRKAAEHLGLKFKLVINGQPLI